MSENHRETTVDLFVTEPFDYEVEYREALVAEVAPGVVMRFVRLQALIEMKEEIGRQAREGDGRPSGPPSGHSDNTGR